MTQAATAGNVPSTAPSAHRTSFFNTLASEWSKLVSSRSTYITLAIGVLLSVALSVLVGFAIGSTWDETDASIQADFEPIMTSLAGILVGLIAFSVFGVLAVTGEYGSGMIRLTLTVTPRRTRVFAAKALLVFLILLPLGLIASFAMFLVGQAIFDSYGVPSTDLGDTDALRAVIGVGAGTPFYALIGLSLGFLLRSTAAAITAVLALIWLPEIFTAFLPEWWRENIFSRLPGASLDSFTIGHIVDSSTYPEPWEGAVATALWLIVFLGAAWVAFLRRDA